MVPRWLVQVLHPLRSFNVGHFGMAKVTELKSMASRSMAWPPYWISYRSKNWFKSYWGGNIDRQTDSHYSDLICLTFLFKESRLRIKVGRNLTYYIPLVQTF
jgi:hypothetical protein